MSLKKVMLTIAVGATVILSLVAIGPFTYFDKVVPILAPVLPRPEGVPADASASYEWKASGLYWSWSRKPIKGCISWRKANDYVSVSLAIEEVICPDQSQQFKFLVVRDGDVILTDANRVSHTDPSSYALSTIEYEHLMAVLDSALVDPESQFERESLAAIKRWLDAVEVN